MNKAIRQKVASVELRPNDGPSAHLWAVCSTAVLECGHRHNLGAGDASGRVGRRMACHDCGLATINGQPCSVPVRSGGLEPK